MPHAHVNLEEEVTIKLTKNQTLLLLTAASQFMNYFGVVQDLTDEQIGQIGGLADTLNRLVKSNPTATHNQEASIALHEAIVKLVHWVPHGSMQ